MPIVRDNSFLSFDPTPWEHPFLSRRNIRRFREYSERIWEAVEKTEPEIGSCAFSTNMAQNMYKWACIFKAFGGDATVHLDPQDNSAINQPEWEEYDGDWADIHDGEGFLEHCREPGKISVVRPELIDSDPLFSIARALQEGNVGPLVDLTQNHPTIRLLEMCMWPGFMATFPAVKELARADVIYAASNPISAYFSGKPYSVFSVGGDLQIDAGRSEPSGQLMRLAFGGAHLLHASNPHTLGHCRRLGLRNAVYSPYPMDTEKYCPGEGKARQSWSERTGADKFVLCTARLDDAVKGVSGTVWDGLVRFAEQNPSVAFVFLKWGESANRFAEQIEGLSCRSQFLMLPPVGKVRLIDYYRSCDAVLDQFVYGYYGATALEAASIGKPVVMFLRTEHYDPLYDGDVMPAVNVSPDHVGEGLRTALARHAEKDLGEEMREWAVRNHGEERAGRLMLGLLEMARRREPVPSHLESPLNDPLSEEEIEYHNNCLTSVE